MSKPAARIGDQHVCPMTAPSPHVGGPVGGPGIPDVLIGGLPAATMGDSCICSGPPDTIILGSTTVLIGGRPAARAGDPCAHGGSVLSGLPTVLIGSAAGGISTLPPDVLLEIIPAMPLREQSVIMQTLALRSAAVKAQALAHLISGCPICAKKYRSS